MLNDDTAIEAHIHALLSKQLFICSSTSRMQAYLRHNCSTGPIIWRCNIQHPNTWLAVCTKQDLTGVSVVPPELGTHVLYGIRVLWVSACVCNVVCAGLVQVKKIRELPYSLQQWHSM